MKDNPDRRWHSWPHIGLAGAGALLYVVGFVVANAHLAQYGLVRWTVIEGRYIGAGLLFVVTQILPFSGGYFLWVYPRPPDTPNRWRQLWLPITAVIAAVMASASLVNFGMVETGDSYYSGPVGFSVVAALLGWFTARFFAAQPKSTGDTELARRSSDWLAGTGIALVVFAAAGVFGRTVYPHVSPAWGGGGATYGFVTLHDGELPGQYELFPVSEEQQFASPVLLVDRSENFLTFVRCVYAPDGKQGLARSGEVALSEVARVEFTELAVVPREIAFWKSKGCPARDLEADTAFIRR